MRADFFPHEKEKFTKERKAFAVTHQQIVEIQFGCRDARERKKGGRDKSAHLIKRL